MSTDNVADAARRPPLPTPLDPESQLARFDASEPPAPIEQAASRGLRYLHVWTSRTREEAWQARLSVQTLMELLIAKGVVSAEELDRQAETTGPAVMDAFQADPLAPVLGPDDDKYTTASSDVDCAARFHLCQARCCRLRFALSPQDLDEGIVRWEYSRPYLNAQRPDGFCAHNQRETGYCGVYAHRPVICRTYDCRTDKRIWQDFEARIPADYAAIDAEWRAKQASHRARLAGQTPSDPSPA